MPHDFSTAGRGRLAITTLLWFAACSDDTTPSASSESSSSGESTSGTTMQPTTTSVTSADTSTTANEESSTSPASSESTTTADTETTTDATESSTSTDATESSSTNAEESSESGVVELECPVADLDPDNQDPIFGNTTGRDDDFSGSCGGDGSPDVGFTFTAPADGIYTFDTSNSQLDTVLYLLDGVCGGSEIACNDNGDGSQSVITVQLAAAQTVTAIVDGNSAGGAPFSLRVRAGDFTCPVGDLGSVSPTETIGDTSDAYNSFASTCGGYAGPEDGWIFTAPVTATYTIDTFNSSFQSVVHVNDGVCGGAELACGSQGSLVDLVAGQQVTIFVDGPAASGAYELHVDTLGGACPDQDLGNTVPQTIPGDTSDGDNTDSSTCGGDFSPDDLYTFTAPEAGLYTFDTFGSAIDTILFVRSNDCDGAELACNDDVDAMTDESRILLGMGQDQTVLVGVDGNEIGAYTLNIEPVACPDSDAGNTVPQTLFGSTAGGFDKLAGSCRYPGPATYDAPDYSYSFTAPEDGEYVFDTNGTFFSNVLYVLDGPACNAPEIACSDNFQFGYAFASLPLTANQTVTVVVDGNFGDEGNFTLNIQQLGGVCPTGDLGSTVPQSIDGDTSDSVNNIAGSCGGIAQADDSYTFTAPEDGLYVFDTVGSSYNTVLYLRQDGCDGAELACNFGFPQTSVATTLAADQTVVVGVDGYDGVGAYTLNVQQVSCPDEDIDSTFPASVVGDILGAADYLQSEGCPDDGSGDYAVEFTAPADGTYSFDLSGSDYDTVLYIQDGACGGPQLACNDDFFGVQSFLSLDLVADQTVVVVVSGFFGDSGNFDLEIY